MVFSEQLTPSRGQEFRDRVRCTELQNLGFNVFTVDDKHNEDDYIHPGKHCNANFNSDRGLLKQLQLKWGDDIKFIHIILDYFFCPIGWTRSRWLPSFFSKTIPMMALKLLSPAGILWLPHLQHVTESINLNRPSIENYFIVHEIDEPMKNPLYVATENATDELKRCPDQYLNENQFQPLLIESRFPFYALQSKSTQQQQSKITQPLIVENEIKQPLMVENDDADDGGAQDTLRMWEAISKTPNVASGILVRVFTGAEASNQKGPFQVAMLNFKRSFTTTTSRTIIVEELSTKQLCAYKWQPRQFVDWLANAHAYFMLGHVHQSLRLHNLFWYMPEALSEYQRLTYHRGFPSGEQLRCPVFTQDKYAYIKVLGKLAIKTLTIPVTEGGQYTPTCLAEVHRFVIIIIVRFPILNIKMMTSYRVIRFMEDNEENGCGWVIKAPFTTNCESVRFAKSFDHMKTFMGSLSKKYFGNVPYLMIQPCMYNRFEAKIVVLNNQPLYKAGIITGSQSKSNGGIRRAFSDMDGLLTFAGVALEKFRSAAPYAITDGLFRVDIFQNLSGHMVVNEFESLEADYGCKPSGSVDFQSFTCTFLTNYWRKKIESLIIEA